MLALGSSEHWTYSLKLLSGETTVNANAILEYFEPLIDWLKTENTKYPNDPVGW
jgi:peptidyl-dipeptidase A